MHPFPDYLMELAKALGVKKVMLVFTGSEEEGGLLEVLSDVNDVEFENAVFGWAWMTYDFEGQYTYNYTCTYDLDNMVLHITGCEGFLCEEENAYEGTWRE